MKTSANTAPVTSRSSPELNRKQRGAVLPLSKLRLVGLNDLDGRTSATKRARALAAALTEELGGHALTATQDAAVERAATLVALAEDLRTRRLAGDMTVSLEDMTRVDSAADRAMRRLGIKPGAPRDTVPGIEQIARHIADEDDAATADGDAA